MIKAVIFDMDGLLIDSEPIWQEAEIKTFKKVGVPLTRKKTDQTAGLREDEVVDYWYSRYPWKGPTKKEVYRKVVKEVVRLIKKKGVSQKNGAREIIKLFLDQGIPIAIASSSERGIIDAALERISIRKYVKVVHSAEKEPLGKPHPGVFIATARKLKIRPADCLVFEDSPQGVLAAKAAKMKCVVVPDQISKDDKRFCIADMIIHSLKEFSLEDLKKL